MILALLITATVVPSGQSFHCTPIAVWDGDGPIWCEEGPHIRLSGIAAREMDGACKPGHPCPNVDARAARDYLARLVGTPTGTLRTGHIKVAGPDYALPISRQRWRQSHRSVLQFAQVG